LDALERLEVQRRSVGMPVGRDAKRGSWYYVVDAPLPGGRRKQLRRRGFKTKKEAQGALAAVVADQQRGVYVPPDRITFLLSEWLPARASTLRPSTAAAYEQMIRTYVVPSLAHARLQQLTPSLLNALYGRLLSEGRTETRRGLGPGLSAKTVRNIHGVLTKAFRDGVRWAGFCATRVTPPILPAAAPLR
jgi:hypothetical protein